MIDIQIIGFCIIVSFSHTHQITLSFSSLYWVVINNFVSPIMLTIVIESITLLLTKFIFLTFSNRDQEFLKLQNQVKFIQHTDNCYGWEDCP